MRAHPPREATRHAPRRCDTPRGVTGKALEEFPAERSSPESAGENLVTNKLPVLVPPAETKTPFFRNDCLRRSGLRRRSTARCRRISDDGYQRRLCCRVPGTAEGERRCR